MRTKRFVLAAAVAAAATVEASVQQSPAPAAARGRVRIVQTNAAGDSVMLIDPATNRVVGEIKDIEVNHGAAAAPDGSRFYITNESQSTLDIVDGKTLRVIKQVPLSNRPNNLSIGKDGKRLYVAIVGGPGAVDVIDAPSMTRAKSIATEGGIHNTFTTPDGKFVVAGSIVGRRISIIDASTEAIVATIPMEAGVRPICFETNPDGSTKRMFVQLSDYHGFVTVDWKTRQIVDRVKLPDVPASERHTEGLQGSPSHGLGITPDGKTLWVDSKMNSHVYAYSIPDLKLLGGVKVGDHPDWLTFTPDSARVYVANAGSNSVSVVDVATRKELTRIPVGQVPKRNITAVVP
jgi:YVTN family beta-propeller protein